jgi:membrane-bound metal-dependent hydrolase YbcI (DUF457 family)
MFFVAHILLGMIIGKITGNYLLAIIFSVIIDIDHLFVFAKHKILFNFKDFMNTVMDPEDRTGHQRNYLHNVFALVILSFIVFLLFREFWIVFFFSYLGHLFLDMIDKSDFYPLYPFRNWNFKGFVEYGSKEEIVFSLALFFVYYFI